jgi:hypothetical protein
MALRASGQSSGPRIGGSASPVIDQDRGMGFTASPETPSRSSPEEPAVIYRD